MIRQRMSFVENSRQPEHLPGKLIVRFKEEAVAIVARELAAAPASRSTRSAVASAMPDQIAGPLALLRKEGARSIQPMFVPPSRSLATHQPSFRLEATSRSLTRSATDVPHDALRGFQMVEIGTRKDPASLIRKLQRFNTVAFAEPVPNRWLAAPRKAPRARAADPLVNRQWGLRAIRWFEKARPDARSVAVAVLDSGIDDMHPDLQAAIAAYDHAPHAKRDVLGHGTHVSGIIAATINNQVGINGVADCKLHCWKIFFDPPPRSDDADFDFDSYSKGLAAVLDSDIKVVNLSIGGTASSQTEAILFRELADAGVVVVAAMGNEYEKGNPIEYPAAYPGVVAIGAVDESDRRASFSNTGRHIALVAPGVAILSTVPRRKAVLANAVDYDSWPGTSMATPHVAGCAALLYAGLPRSKTNAVRIVKRLKDKARRLPGMNGRAFTNDYGHGMLDIAATL